MSKSKWILNKNTGIIQTFYGKVIVETNHAQTEPKKMRLEYNNQKINNKKCVACDYPHLNQQQIILKINNNREGNQINP